MMEKGTFLQRYHKVKKELMEAALKRTGYNKNKGYYYFQLADFLPTLLSLEEKYGIADLITFEHDKATIRLYDATEESVEPVITCAMPFPKDFNEADTNKMKLLGGAETYCRRYLYFTVFNMSVQDVAELKTDMEEQEQAEENKQIPVESSKELPFFEELWEKENEAEKFSQGESVKDILETMTREDAMQTKLPVGPHKNKTLGEIISKNQAGPDFLGWLIQQKENGPYGNRIIAAAYKLIN